MRKYSGLAALLGATGLAVGCGTNNVVTTPATIVPALYTETNATTGNAVQAYARNGDGSLSVIGTYATGGIGVGLPTQAGALPFPIGGATGAVRLSANGNYLYAVDAGSGDIAAFSVAASGALTLIASYPTGGSAPASIGIDPTGQYLYVLNTGSVSVGTNTAGGITGFTVSSTGTLAPLAGSTQILSATQYVDPSEVAFSPDGTYLVVTEKATGLIDLYPVTAGVAGKPFSLPSSGSIPFGFAFTSTGTLVVANAESTTNLTAATVSSYTPSAKGTLAVVSARVPDTQAAACWIALTTDGLNGYTTNTLSGTVSGYTIAATGALTLLTTGGVTASQANTTGPIDDIVTPNNAYLYVLDSYAGKQAGTIAGFSIGTTRGLTAITTGVSGLAVGSIGLAVR